MFYLILLFLALLMGIYLFIGFIRYLIKLKEWKKRLQVIAAFSSIFLIVVLPYYFVETYKLGAVPHQPTTDYYSLFNNSSNTYEDSLDYEHHFQEVESFKNEMDRQRQFVNYPNSHFEEMLGSQNIVKRFEGYKASSDSLIRDVGYLFYSLHGAYIGLDPSMGLTEMSLISNKEMPYFEFVEGCVHMSFRSFDHFDEAEGELIVATQKEECKVRGYEELAWLYWYVQESEKLQGLIYDKETVDYVPFYLKRTVYFKGLDVLNYWGVIFHNEFNKWHVYSFLSAFVLFLSWLFLLRKLDIYEPEKWKYLWLTFLLSCISIFLIYPFHDLLRLIPNYYRPSHPLSDFVFITFNTGMIEEFVKILPLLFMMRFTKAVNEPFDYVLYASLGGLGFAFIENIQYYENAFNISSRGFICYLVHMVFSGTVGYGIMLAKYRRYHPFLMFSTFFILAAILHGFYDFWLMNWWALDYGWVSDLTIIIAIQLFVLYVNNTLSISNFYDPQVHFNREGMKVKVLILSAVVLITGYLAIANVWGSYIAHSYLISSFFRLIFFMFFFAISLSFIKPIRGYIKPLGFNWISSWKKKYKHDLTGLSLILTISKKHTVDDALITSVDELNQHVHLLSRFVVDDNLEGYIALLSNPIKVKDNYTNQIVLIPHWDGNRLDDRSRVLTRIYALENDDIRYQPIVRSTDLIYLGKLFSMNVPQKKLSKVGTKHFAT